MLRGRLRKVDSNDGQRVAVDDAPNCDIMLCDDVIDIDGIGEHEKKRSGFGLNNRLAVWKLVNETVKRKLSNAYDRDGDKAVVWTGSTRDVFVYFSDIKNIVRQSVIRGNVIDACAEMLVSKQNVLSAGVVFVEKSYFFCSICLKGNVVNFVREKQLLSSGANVVLTQDRDCLLEVVTDSPQQRLDSFSYDAEICRYSYPYMISRSLFADAAIVASGEVSKVGPLVEYERRIEAGDLVDGHNCQNFRDYELAKSAEACRLDWYAASEKAGRSRWLWSRFIPQSSYSPVKDSISMEEPSYWRKKRIHFHDFMLDGHLQKHKGVPDPLEFVAGEISDESILLCLDEFMVADVADALILNHLFGHLFSNGVILVATSNCAPDNLYEGGLQRDLFLPFISTLKERCVVLEIGSSTDYRKMTSVPLGANGCAYFPFEELCDKPLGAADYFGLFTLDGVPIFRLHNRTAAYRFVTLVDVMYENKARLMCTAEGTPVELFEKIVTISNAQQMAPRTSSRSRKNDDLDLCVDNELGFAKDRTISRLTEMNSKEYSEQHSAMLS
ncbi:AFG1-like ATPase [Camellia lanceoleosa]|uniref:AFG1-like ATPase n=1 Tax=Camellia lanceoleosa TaxID=1840588 RepID=A0ACC0H8S5_9ERIC|nr:AFG1-like ATPase [Camellia lanceoleosa]